MFEEQCKNLEGLIRKPDLYTAFPQFPSSDVRLEDAKPDHT
jgi:hypothetical protein